MSSHLGARARLPGGRLRALQKPGRAQLPGPMRRPPGGTLLSWTLVNWWKRSRGRERHVRVTDSRGTGRMCSLQNTSVVPRKRPKEGLVLIPDAQIGQGASPCLRRGRGEGARPGTRCSRGDLHTGRLREWGRVSPANRRGRVQTTTAGWHHPTRHVCNVSQRAATSKSWAPPGLDPTARGPTVCRALGRESSMMNSLNPQTALPGRVHWPRSTTVKALA